MVECTIKAFELPKVSFSDLFAFQPDSISDLRENLLNLGAVQITDIPKFKEARLKALAGSGVCLSRNNDNGIFQRSMNDGSIRFSVAASTKNGIRDASMSHHCGDSANMLRTLIDSVSRQVFLALDSSIKSKGVHVMLPSYSSFLDLMNKGNHLEHLHAYFPRSVASSTTESIETMRLHTDNGLMIAMTAGLYENGVPTESSGLYIALPDQEQVKVTVEDDSLILLMGEGASKWFRPVLGKPFRAVPHSLRLDFSSLTMEQRSWISRSWFGKMFLPPSDAIIPEGNIPYQEYHREEMKSSPSLPLACEIESSSSSSSSSRQLRNIFVQDTSCPSGEMMCWGQCQSVSSLSCGSDAMCMNLQTNEPADPTKMCHGDSNYPDGIYCVLECPAGWNVTTTASNDDYCYGDGTSMSMTGFFSIVEDTSGSTPCVNLLFEEWTLDNSTKFGVACFGILCIGIIVQYLTLLKSQLKKQFPQLLQKSIYLFRFVKMFIFGIQIVLSYFLMLVAMTYSVELFTMVVVGLTIGYGLFGTMLPDHEQPNADPCCPPEQEELSSPTMNKFIFTGSTDDDKVNLNPNNNKN